MVEFTIRKYSEEEYEQELKNKLKEKGLYDSVEDILNEIVDSNRGFGYLHFALMAELSCDILKLIELSEVRNETTRLY